MPVLLLSNIEIEWLGVCIEYEDEFMGYTALANQVFFALIPESVWISPTYNIVTQYLSVSINNLSEYLY